VTVPTCNAKNSAISRVKLQDSQRQNEVRELVMKTGGGQTDGRARPRVTIKLLLGHSRGHQLLLLLL